MGDFDSVKIGVCDSYWTGPGSSTEIFLGLTKGGVDLTYTPTWYDLETDRYGKTPADASLTGESLSIKIPLAETDMNKLEMFAHTGTVTNGTGASAGQSNLGFGRFPGFRLGNCAGRLRLHPISSGSDLSDDIVVYKAVNKAPLNLQYKLDAERIFATEFIGMVSKNNANGAMLFQIGDSSF